MKIYAVSNLEKSGQNWGALSQQMLKKQYTTVQAMFSSTKPKMDANQVPKGYALSVWRVEEMDCPVEEGMIYQIMSKRNDVKQTDCNLVLRQLSVVHREGVKADLESALRQIGMTPQPIEEVSGPAGDHHEDINWIKLGAAGGFALAAELAHLASLPGWFAENTIHLPEWVSVLLAIISVILCGLTTFKKGLLAIRHGNLNINALMSVAVIGAMITNNWPEAAMVMFLFTIAELLEARSLDKARRAVQGLVSLLPDNATVQQVDGSWLEQEVSYVKVNDIVRVRPGEKIPLDGELIFGYSTVNQAPITGESVPIDKKKGDSVFGGTINQEGSFEYRITAASNDSTLARIIRVVEQAQGSKAPTQRFIDRFSRIYTPAVFTIAVLVAIIPPLFFAQTWEEWIYKGLVLLVIACPCALVISTPVTIVSGLTAAARRGILVKGGVYLELGRKLTWLALDKTGTITQGKPVQTDFMVIDSDNSDAVHLLAASLAARSDHPVSYAVATAAEGLRNRFSEVIGFSAILGRGTQGDIDGKRYYLGNLLLMQEKGIIDDAAFRICDEWEKQGKTVIMFANSERILALFAVADTVRVESKQAIKRIHRMGVKTMMLTGDNNSVAQSIASQVGIDKVHSNLLPESKLSVIADYVDNHEVVGMVGDGINDAPALAEANIGFAMAGSGTDTAIETADVALMNDDLNKIADFIKLSKRTYSVLMQNIILSLGLKALFLVLTLIGLGSMWMAVFADVGTTILVVFNGLRLLNTRWDK